MLIPLDDRPLIDYDYIRTSINKGEKVILSLVELDEQYVVSEKSSIVDQVCASKSVYKITPRYLPRKVKLISKTVSDRGRKPQLWNALAFLESE